jgi:hypothetical protein
MRATAAAATHEPVGLTLRGLGANHTIEALNEEPIEIAARYPN